MANAFFAPFNNQPTSVTFHTAPVTLGANEYALLRVMPQQELDDNSIQGDQGITINGTLAVPQTFWATADWDGSNAEVDITFEATGILHTYTTVGGGFFRHYRQVNGTNFIVTTNNPTNGYQNFRIQAGDRFDWPGGGFSNAFLKMHLIPDEALPTEMWLPPSTVISSGDGSIVRPYMLERYAAIS